jgi:hypothetical protein
MHVFMLLLALASACSSATAASPPPSRGPADPAVIAALARDLAVALGVGVPATRDRLLLEYEPPPPLPRGITIIRVRDLDAGRVLRLVISDDKATGPRAIAAWPI